MLNSLQLAAGTAALAGVLLMAAVHGPDSGVLLSERALGPESSVHGSFSGTPGAATHDGLEPASDVSASELNELIGRYCVRCHSDRRLTGNLSLEDFDVGAPHLQWEKTEKVIGKLRANLMPPPGANRPSGDAMVALAQTLERSVDTWAVANPNPGNRDFQRLNQAEYARAVRDLIGLEMDPAEYLPPDQRSANFDNIADAQLLSPTLVTAYMNAAAAVSRMALGDPLITPSQRVYRAPQQVSQRVRIDGAPIGSRGGISETHNFPADGEYVFRVGFAHSLTGDVFARTTLQEKVEISIDGVRVALIEMDHWLSEGDAVGLYVDTDPIAVRAGPRRVSAVFVKGAEGPVDDLLSPHELTLADRHVGDAGFGVELLPHLTSLQLTGPFRVTGVSDTEIRTRIMLCSPESPHEERPCAERVLSELLHRAFRGTGTAEDVEGLMAVYDQAALEQGFEAGIRVGLQAILASPKFIFRMEQPGGAIERGEQLYAISDVALASRLSFFLWNLPPDQELLDLARSGRLNNDEELERQVHRMIADPRAEALGTRFASQWFRLHDLDRAVPDQFWFPDFNEQLKQAMRKETELFFLSLVREDRSYFDLLGADYTFLNERLAHHYGIPGVVGDEMRKVKLEDGNRRGLLGHGSVLTLTSFGNRTSIVNRGKWVLEVLLNTPPPPPPPGVPPLEETEGAEPGVVLTSKARQEMHIANPSCAGCHSMMDPIGLPLEMFDPTGRERRVERRDMGHVAIPLETEGELWDGSPASSPAELGHALMSYPETMSRGFASNLLTYALGRRVEYFDQPTIRAITAEARENDYRISSFISGVVLSDPFRTMKGEVTAAEAGDFRFQ